MSSKRKTPARRKVNQAQSQLSAPAAQSAVQEESPISAPALVEATSPLPAPLPERAPAAPVQAVRAEAPRAPAPSPRISSDERHRMIARVAYGYAERAGFRNNPVENWLMAEREVDDRLSRLAS